MAIKKLSGFARETFKKKRLKYMRAADMNRSVKRVASSSFSTSSTASLGGSGEGGSGLRGGVASVGRVEVSVELG